MINIQIYKDGSLKLAYGSLLVLLLIISGGCYLFGSEKYTNFLFGSVLLLILLIPQLDSRPLLIIDQRGLKKKGKAIIDWNQVETLEFEKRKFENTGWILFKIRIKNQSKPVTLNLKRTTVNPKELYQKLIQYSDASDKYLNIIGLKKWKTG